MNSNDRTPDKTRLGRLLVEKQLISHAQLEAAILAQGQSGRRLGEILADMKLITQAQVRGAIRRQRRLRMAAALATTLLGPLHACAAAAGAPAVSASTSASVSARGFGAQPLSEQALGAVTAQRRPDEAPGAGAAGAADAAMTNALREQARQAELRLQALDVISAREAQAASQAAVRHGLPDGGVKVLGDLAQVLNPLTLLLSADISVGNVSYDAGNSVASVGKDGAVTLKVPSSIGEISFHNIRVGSQPGPGFGSAAIRDIDLRAATLTIKPR
ncbi:hypothetical protein [Massilia sp. 9096]|uniref:hypothetical protein n=1 Tax=Massilia sp. 9096 TaxID=1500894 RepID=UPI000A8440B4|nr:hypothetical protein [Massilia sp. 9096]